MSFDNANVTPVSDDSQSASFDGLLRSYSRLLAEHEALQARCEGLQAELAASHEARAEEEEENTALQAQCERWEADHHRYWLLRSTILHYDSKAMRASMTPLQKLCLLAVYAQNYTLPGAPQHLWPFPVGELPYIVGRARHTIAEAMASLTDAGLIEQHYHYGGGFGGKSVRLAVGRLLGKGEVLAAPRRRQVKRAPARRTTHTMLAASPPAAPTPVRVTGTPGRYNYARLRWLQIKRGGGPMAMGAGPLTAEEEEELRGLEAAKKEEEEEERAASKPARTQHRRRGTAAKRKPARR